MDKNWLVYQPVLSVVDKNSWYINRFCRSWTILGGKFHGCVLLGQYWLVNQPGFFLSWTVMIVLSPCFVCRGQYWLVSPYIVYDEQKWLVYHPVLSVMDSNGWYIS